jgi:hypothetical protein
LSMAAIRSTSVFLYFDICRTIVRTGTARQAKSPVAPGSAITTVRAPATDDQRPRSRSLPECTLGTTSPPRYDAPFQLSIACLLRTNALLEQSGPARLAKRRQRRVQFRNATLTRDPISDTPCKNYNSGR